MRFRPADTAPPTVLPRVPGITYHGGPIMLGTTKIYYIYYGNWAAELLGRTILQDFASSIGGSPYYAINTGYYDFAARNVSDGVVFGGFTTDNYSQGLTAVIGEVRAQNIVSLAITGGGLPNDPNGIYFVLTSPDVVESSGFCGYHNSITVGPNDIKYAVVGNKATQNLSSCAPQTLSSPNSNPPIDAMVNVIAHELGEVVTDPNLNAWFDSYNNENGDKCEWTFGHTYTAPNGSKANMVLGARNYMIQQNWVNSFGGYCALNLTVPALTSVDPGIMPIGSVLQVTITGFNLSGATINPLAGITISNLVTSSQLMTATFTVAAGALPGLRILSVTTGSGISNDLSFTVGPPAPVLTSITPPSGTRGLSVPVTLFGSNLGGATINAGGGISVSGAVPTATQITAILNIPANAPPGPTSINVTGPGGTSNSISFTIESVSGPPVLFSVNPPSGQQGTTFSVVITGNNFSSPAEILMLDSSGVSVSGITVVNSSLMNATFTVSNFAGRRNSFTVRTALGLSNSLNFDVLPGVPNPVPTLTSISPPTIGQGQSAMVTLSGFNLSGASINPIPGVTISAVSATATQMTALFTIGAATPLGTKSVNVTNANGPSNAVTFQVTLAGITLTSISPPSGPPGANVTVTLFGNNLTGATINAIAGVTITGPVVSATQIIATFNISPGAASGARSVTVTAGGNTSNSVEFTVAGAGPLLSSISPNTARAGTSLVVLFSGTGLAGATVTPIPGITITNVVSSATAIAATFDISVGATPGVVNATVTGTSVSNGVPFTIEPLRDRR